MSFLKRRFEPVYDPREHEMRECLIVHLPDCVEADCEAFEAALCRECQRTGVNLCGGTEQEGTEVAIYFYGPEVGPLFAALKPVLLAHPDASNAEITLATGYRDTREYTRFPLHTLEASPDLAAAPRSTP